MNRPESIFYRLLLKKISGGITRDEMQQLTDLLKAFPEFSEAYEAAQWLWNNADITSPAPGAETTEHRWARHLQQMQERGLVPPQPAEQPAARQGTAMRKRRPYLLAASLALVACISAGIFYYITAYRTMPEAGQPNVVMTRPGSRSKLILPDGTTVWLNANSKLTYSNNFLKGERRVQLDGEAYFDVVKDEQRPFFINTAVMSVKVLGTRLNLRSYTGDRKAEAVLITGKIEVQVNRRPEEHYLLSPYEKLSLIDNKVQHDKTGNTPAPPIKALVISNVHFCDADSTVAETAWIDNKLVFAGEPLAELATRMERWYGASIVIPDTSLQRFRVSGSLRDESLEEALKAISMITGCKYKLKDHAAELYYE